MSHPKLERRKEYLIYTVSYQNMIELWVETMHPDGHVVAVWDAKNHIDLLKKNGLLVSLERIYDNKVLTLEVPEIINAFNIMDTLTKDNDEAPFIQVYSEGKLITDNIES